MKPPGEGFIVHWADECGEVSRAEGNCTSRAEQNCTTGRRGVSIEVSWSVRAWVLVSRLMLVGLPALLEAEALPVHLQDMDMVGEAVQECAGQAL